MLCHENTGSASRPMWIRKSKLEKDIGDELKEIGRGQIMQSFPAVVMTLHFVLILGGRH